MRYAFIATHQHEFGVKRMCQALEVGRSGYYAWRTRPISRREKVDQELVGKIQVEYQQSRKTYGSPRVHAALQRKGILCGHNRVARLMRAHGLAARKRHKRFPVTSQRQSGAIPAPNLLRGDFSAAAQPEMGDRHHLH